MAISAAVTARQPEQQSDSESDRNFPLVRNRWTAADLEAEYVADNDTYSVGSPAVLTNDDVPRDSDVESDSFEDVPRDSDVESDSFVCESPLPEASGNNRTGSGLCANVLPFLFDNTPSGSVCNSRQNQTSDGLAPSVSLFRNRREFFTKLPITKLTHLPPSPLSSVSPSPLSNPSLSPLGIAPSIPLSNAASVQPDPTVENLGAPVDVRRLIKDSCDTFDVVPIFDMQLRSRRVSSSTAAKDSLVVVADRSTSLKKNGISYLFYNLFCRSCLAALNLFQVNFFA